LDNSHVVMQGVQKMWRHGAMLGSDASEWQMGHRMLLTQVSQRMIFSLSAKQFSEERRRGFAR
jgi:hypothetical protein